MELKKYITMFLQEMRTNVQELSQMLVDLERDPHDMDLLQKIMRVSHSCKGACKMMKFDKTSELCHAMEDVFDAARHNTKEIDTLGIDLSLAAMDEIERSVNSIEKTEKEPDDIGLAPLLRGWLEGKPIDSSALQSIRAPKKDDADDSMFTRIPSIRVDTEKLDHLLNLAGEVSLLQLQLASASAEERGDLIETLGRLSEELTNKVIQSRLVPLEHVFSRFPRLIRDLAQAQGKQIQFEMSGIDHELDKTLVDHLVTPLIHILRNAVDHGIEMPEERQKAGKNPEGKIRLGLRQAEGYTVVTVEDDGTKIDIERMKKIATERGIEASKVQNLSNDNVLDLLCDPRFSSKGEVTQVSGRGVGMSAVQEEVDALGGKLELKIEPESKQFVLSLPLQLSIVRSLLVESGGTTYAMPFVHIDRLLQIPLSQVKSQLGTMSAVIDEQDVPLVDVTRALDSGTGMESKKNPEKKAIEVVLTKTQFGSVGLVVDRIQDSRDVLVKPVPASMKSREMYSGSTILDTGSVSMIVDIPRLLSLVETTLSSPSRHENR